MPLTQTHRTIEANGIKMHYVEAGDGPPVILLHGFPETWYAWRKQIPVLAEHYRLIVPDLRGYGNTDKPATGYDKRTMAADIRDLMHKLGIKRAPIIGHDRGARVATRFAKDYPDVIDRLGVLDNVPTLVLFEEMDATVAKGNWFFIFNQVPHLPEALIAGREDIWLRYILEGWTYNPLLLTPDELDVYIRAYRLPGTVRGAMSDYSAGGEDVAQDKVDRDKKITCPTLALWGEDFEIVGKMFDVAAIWGDMTTDLKTVSIPQCCHLPHEERPEIVNPALLDFLKGWTG